jgi:hypothetical protein
VKVQQQQQREKQKQLRGKDSWGEDGGDEEGNGGGGGNSSNPAGSTVWGQKIDVINKVKAAPPGPRKPTTTPGSGYAVRLESNQQAAVLPANSMEKLTAHKAAEGPIKPPDNWGRRKAKWGDSDSDSD